MKAFINPLLCGVVLLSAGCATQQNGPADAARPADMEQMPVERYQLAESRLLDNTEAVVLNHDIEHHWIPGSPRLWYQRETPSGHEYVVVDVEAQTRAAAFDHQRMARALSAVFEEDISPGELPIQALVFEDPAQSPTVMARGRLLRCDLEVPVCSGPEPTAPDTAAMPSPNGRWAVSLRDHNLWLRDLSDGSERALTDDGAPDLAWGKLPESSTAEITLRRSGALLPPIGIWSPDGTRFLTYRLDQSDVPLLHLVQHLPEAEQAWRPVLHSYRYPFPGDNYPLASYAVFDVGQGTRADFDLGPLPLPLYDLIALNQLEWRADGQALHLLVETDHYRSQALYRVDPATGRSERLFGENMDTQIQPGPSFLIVNHRVLSNGDIIWYSERSGWGHLYLVSGDDPDRVIPLTSGPWVVHEVVRIDEDAGQVYFTAAGREPGSHPYLRKLYRARIDSSGLDGSGPELLTPETADHHIASAGGPLAKLLSPQAPGPLEAAFSPDGRYFVNRYSLPEMPTVTVVRDAAGKVVMELEKARILEENYPLAERFEVLAADGETRLYGKLHKPTDFDPSRTYPVIDNIYPGPQANRVRYGFLDDRGELQALAELGFIVLTLDGRGTPGRSKAFRDESYGRLETAGTLEDHVAAIRQLAGRHPWIDADRVGIYGTSGGGFATAHAMFDHPDFFKVGVASAGNHDERLYIATWGERYQGPLDDSYAAVASYANAAQFRGKLLLAHGDMDDNVHPAQTYRVADALIKANKDFDMLMMPNVNHGISQNNYFKRRTWDYFVRHLGGQEPPPYRLGGDQ